MISRLPFLGKVTALAMGRHYVVRGGSMTPSLVPGQYVKVNPLAYSDRAPRRGDVVLVRDPQGPRRSNIKRVVGLPGEAVWFRDGLLWVDGEPVDEPYLNGLPSSIGLGEQGWQLSAGEFAVAGDNRARSTDSREHGPLPAELILGKVWISIWPPKRWGRVR